MNTPEFRPMTSDHATAVAAVHLAAFPGFFLSFLGPRFLSIFYAAVATDGDGVAYVALAGSTIVGFVAGSIRPRETYRRLLRRRWLSITLGVAWSCIRRPPTVWRIVSRMIRRTTGASSDRGAAELMSLGVAPTDRHHGIGRSLVQQFVAESRRRGSTAVTLNTDAAENEKVNAFYASLGFVLTSTRQTHEGRWMNEYRIEFETH